jgi:hypothetical protein
MARLPFATIPHRRWGMVRKTGIGTLGGYIARQGVVYKYRKEFEKDRGHGKVVMGKTKYLLNIVLIT